MKFFLKIKKSFNFTNKIAKDAISRKRKSYVTFELLMRNKLDESHRLIIFAKNRMSRFLSEFISKSPL